MASISNDKTGGRRIQFIDSTRNRRAIRLGRVTARQAEAVKVRIEELVSSSITGHPPSDQMSTWLTNLDDVLYDKLAKTGLVEERGASTIGPFTRAYIDGRIDLKPATIINLERAREYLLSKFSEDRPLRKFDTGDAEALRLHLIGRGLSENTIRRALGRCRQFFNAAKKRKLVSENPFDEVSVTVRSNTSRYHFVSRSDAQQVLDACPDAEWRLIFALARFGGLRCPSEVLSLTWGDINWDKGRIRVPSPKTERHEGGESRLIPMFPELRPYLMQAFDEAEDGSAYVISRYRDKSVNLRTHMNRIILNAGIEPWPKTFQNLRSTRETELCENNPIHRVCAWLGNSPTVAARHYLQVTDEDFDRASAIPTNNVDDADGEVCADDGNAVDDVEYVAPEAAHQVAHQVAQNPAQKAHETARNGRNRIPAADSRSAVTSARFKRLRESSEYFTETKVPCVGLEPT
ncbi:MAG: site-specific integrase, partial [Phycisphaerales bacterium]|nr:site-specific integrase [Phycisphaerales bacterium]